MREDLLKPFNLHKEIYEYLEKCGIYLRWDEDWKLWLPTRETMCTRCGRHGAKILMAVTYEEAGMGLNELHVHLFKHHPHLAKGEIDE